MATIYFGSDHAGLELKRKLMAHLEAGQHKVIDLGAFNAEPPTDYPDVAHVVADEVIEKVRENAGDVRGVLVCGTGIGMCMAANRHQGIRAANCESEETVKMSRLHNNSNVLCLGGRVLSEEKAKKMIEIFMDTLFEGAERHENRIAKIEHKS